ncbi:pyridoxine-5'-phosphate oxidase [Anaeramoeba flamelloides]|uniref:pyridoxal 5'-phosphate synthase n=1 Tax=Anaeramoeba flamelloides TaxID=1746091 RepID=A0AAV7ZW65_9EUKA|nr:pyridoxine-5'-phosphate oxidase [Anaeramoeba flamelloides]KAJ6229207.1 pyridoxine-5'-phosphate oxidase [Anaeramoeba flamelloides]
MNVEKLQDPSEIIQEKLQEASEKTTPSILASVFTLATYDKESGFPDCRNMVMQKFNQAETSFTFYTVESSDKAKQLTKHPFASLCFYWKPLQIQMRAQGIVVEVSEEEIEQAWSERSRSSQLFLLASRQGEIIETPQLLRNELDRLQEENENVEIFKRPKKWKGFKLVPKSVEFWFDRDRSIKNSVPLRIRFLRRLKQLKTQKARLAFGKWERKIVWP